MCIHTSMLIFLAFVSCFCDLAEGGQTKRYLEIQGIMEIEVRGKVCKVDYNMMIPAAFPRKPPYVRIVNRNSETKVDPFYQKLRSPTDSKSYILNEKLDTVRNWTESTSIVNVIIECHDMMRSNFPFAKSKVGNQDNYGQGNSVTFSAYLGVE